MKQLRFLTTMFFLILALGLVIGIGPASAVLYQDNFTATITNVTNGNVSAFNPYGLTGPPDLGEPTTFSWYIVYDPATINAGGVGFFNGYYPTNQISIAIPISGGGSQIFTKTMDALYGNTQFDNPYGEFAGGQLIQLAYLVDQSPLSSPYTGAITVDFFNNQLWFESGTTGVYSKFTFDAGYGDFDRQVVPIPGALVLLGSGLAALTILRRRQE